MCALNGISTKECSMYMTTVPCHNCAKHIIAAGIKKVVYIEPYPKSKALEFYTNEISKNEQDSEKKVIFIPFKGVGPHRFIDLFSMHSIRWYSRNRKNKDGYVVRWERDRANLRNPMSLMNYIEMEQSAHKQYMRKSIKQERKLSKMAATNVNEKGWNPQESYEKVNKTINEWPNWKKMLIIKCLQYQRMQKKLQ